MARHSGPDPYDVELARARFLLGVISDALDAHAREYAAHGAEWGHTGSMDQVCTKLQRVAEFLGAFDERDDAEPT